MPIGPDPRQIAMNKIMARALGQPVEEEPVDATPEVVAHARRLAAAKAGMTLPEDDGMSFPMKAMGDPELDERMGDVVRAEAMRQGDAERRGALSTMRPTAPPLWAQGDGSKAAFFADRAAPPRSPWSNTPDGQASAQAEVARLWGTGGAVAPPASGDGDPEWWRSEPTRDEAAMERVTQAGQPPVDLWPEGDDAGAAESGRLAQAIAQMRARDAGAEGVAGAEGDDFVRQVGFQAEPVRPSQVLERALLPKTIDPGGPPQFPDGRRPQTREGAQMLRTMQLRADPGYQAAIAAKKANNELPVGDQLSLPVSMPLPNQPNPFTGRAGDERYAGNPAVRQPAPAGEDPTIALLRNGPQGPNAVGQARLDDAAARKAQFDAIRAERADAATAGLPVWVNRAQQANWNIAGQKGQNDRDNMAAQLELARMGMTQQGQQHKDALALKREELGRGEKASAMAAITQSLGNLNAARAKLQAAKQVNPYSTEAATAAQELMSAESTHQFIMQNFAKELGGMSPQSPMGGLPQGPSAQAPVPAGLGADPGGEARQVSSSAAAPSPATGGGLTPEVIAKLNAAKAAAGGDINKFMNILGVDFVHANVPAIREFVSQPAVYGAQALGEAIDRERSSRNLNVAMSPLSQLFGYQAPRSWAVPDNQRTIAGYLRGAFGQ